ncbi:MAG: hypothetical protein ACKV22_05885 [Bryobacteraceae bacterium]
MRPRPAVVEIPAAANPAEGGSPVVALVRELREAGRSGFGRSCGDRTWR